MDNDETQIDWEPQSRQLTFLQACGLSLPFDDKPLHQAIADIIGFGGSAGGGKDIKTSTPIPTPIGWTTMGDISIGDELFDKDGNICRVIAKSKIFHNRTFKMEFDNGESVVAGEGHLWDTMTDTERVAANRLTDEWRKNRRKRRLSQAVAISQKPGVSISVTKMNRERIYKYKKTPTEKTRTTLEIFETKITQNIRINHSINCAGKINTLQADLPIEPYLLGLWLGDGTSAAGSIGMMEEDISQLTQYVKRQILSYKKVKVLGKPFSLVTFVNLTADLRKLGVLKNKHIPTLYLRASIEQRKELLRGILDTDGSCDKRGQIELGLSNRQLAEDSRELVVSLGIKAILQTKKLSEKNIKHKDCHRIKFVAGFPAFELKRKLIRQKQLNFRPTTKRHYIVSVTEVPSVSTQCITVDSPSHTFLVTRSFIPTHNSDSLLIAGAVGALCYPKLNVGYFRREFPQLEGPGGAILRSRELFNDVAKYNEQKHRWTFDTGALLQFCHCANSADVYNYQCFKPDTEILTINGFKNVADIQKGEIVATMNPETREMEYQPTSETQQYQFDGELVVSSSKRRGVSFAVTPNHTMWAGTARHRKLKRYRADKLPKVSVFPTYALWNGIAPSSSITFKGIGNAGKSYKFKMQDWVRFLGWYISEGSRRDSLKGAYRIYISQQNTSGKNEIRFLLKDMGVSYWEGEKEFVIASKPICKYLERFGKKASEKKLTLDLKKMDKEHLEILLDSLVEGDGTWYERGRIGQFVSSSKILADDVMEIAIKCGYRASILECQGNPINSPFGIKPRFHVSLYKKLGDTLTRRIWREKYKGLVYCVTVLPHHTVLIRHGGKTMWTGQSQQFDILLIDEVTQFTKEMIKYLLGRNRQTIESPTFKPFAAFATNPGNVGHQYFKDEFVTIGEPEVVHDYLNETNEIEKHIFIPSKLKDNDILVKRDPGYANRVGNTEINRKVLLEGSWDIFAGQAFMELTREKHIIDDFPIPPEVKLFGAYDQGFNHPFSFGVFMIDRESNVYLIARATDRLKRVDEIARIMEDTCKPFGGVSKLSYIVAGWDCWTRQRDGGPSIAEQFMNSTPKILLIKGSEDRVQGVNQMRKFLAWRGAKVADGKLVDMDPKFKIFKSCEGVYGVLARMIFDTDGPKPEDVLKVDADENGHGGDDDYDMCLKKGTLIQTKHGEIPIEKVKITDYVLTSKGYNKVTWSGMTKQTAKIYKVSLSNGDSLYGTGNHPIYIMGKGFIPIDMVKYGDIIKVCPNPLSLMVLSLGDTLRQKILHIKNTIRQAGIIRKEGVRLYIERFGKVLMDQSQRVNKYIIKMGTNPTMILGTSKYLLPTSTELNIVGAHLTGRGTWIKSDHSLQYGINQQRVDYGTLKIHKRHGLKRSLPKESVSNVQKSILAMLYKKLNIVVTNVTHNIVGITNSIIQLPYVLFVINSFPLVNIEKLKLVHQSAVHVLGIFPAGTDSVYNLAVEKLPEYYANGILVHNCKIALMSRPNPLAPKEIKPPKNSFETFMRKKRDDRLLRQEYVGYNG